MEPPPPSQPPPPSDSAASSPRSRSADVWDAANPSPAAASDLSMPSKLRLMCSYGGHIVPRPHDKSLCYVGGETRIVVVDRNVASLSALSTHLSKTLMHGRPFVLKYQLPNEDLDSLITVSTDEDLDNMIEEHDRTLSNPSLKPSRLRLFLFPLKLESAHSNIGPILDSSAKSDDWFLNALNRGFSDPAPVNCLLALDDDVAAIQGNATDSGRDEKGTKQGQDVHSVPDSPMLENTSSFGSTSSSPSIANLPSIRVRAEEAGGTKLGIEDQFANMIMGPGVGLKQDEGFIVLSSPLQQLPTTAGVAVTSGLGDYMNRAISDDERSDHGLPIGHRKTGVAPQQHPQKSSGGLDLPSPDSVSSDSSLTNAIARQRSVLYQDQVGQLATGLNSVPGNTMEPIINLSEPNTGTQVQQHIQDLGYILQAQVDPHQQPQQHQQNVSQQQQSLVHTNSHYIHQHPAGTVPVTAYYPVYPPQQSHLHHPPQLDQQYSPVYYVPVNQAQAYNLSALPQQPNSSDPTKTNSNPNSNLSALPQTPPSATNVAQPGSYNVNALRNASNGKPEVAQGAVYRLPNSAPSPHIQQQYGGYQIHPSQSMAPTSGGTATFAYNFTNPAHSQQIFYAQHLGPTLSSHYQAVTAEASDVMKQQQIRTSQGQ